DRCLFASSRNFHVELCDIAQTQVWRHVGITRIHADLTAPLTGSKPILEILSDKDRPLRKSEIANLRAVHGVSSIEIFNQRSPPYRAFSSQDDVTLFSHLGSDLSGHPRINVIDTFELDSIVDNVCCAQDHVARV